MRLTGRIYEQLTPAKYPLSAKYDPRWIIENVMGPHPLWLAESLTMHMSLKPGMRVLDLGCGKALTAIFFAKEFGVQVWAVDLWVDPRENLARVREAGAAGKVLPICADAQALPFGADFFDVIVSFDAYHYFGTDALYLPYLQRFAREGAQIGMVSPSFPAYETSEPGYITDYWQSCRHTFRSPAWWKELWQRTGLVDVQLADMAPGGIEDWQIWNEAFLDLGIGPTELLREEVKALSDQRKRAGGLVRLLATKSG